MHMYSPTFPLLPSPPPNQEQVIAFLIFSQV